MHVSVADADEEVVVVVLVPPFDLITIDDDAGATGCPDSEPGVSTMAVAVAVQLSPPEGVVAAFAAVDISISGIDSSRDTLARVVADAAGGLPELSPHPARRLAGRDDEVQWALPPFMATPSSLSVKIEYWIRSSVLEANGGKVLDQCHECNSEARSKYGWDYECWRICMGLS